MIVAAQFKGVHTEGLVCLGTGTLIMVVWVDLGEFCFAYAASFAVEPGFEARILT